MEETVIERMDMGEGITKRIVDELIPIKEVMDIGEGVTKMNVDTDVLGQ